MCVDVEETRVESEVGAQRLRAIKSLLEWLYGPDAAQRVKYRTAPVSYTHLTLPTIYTV